MSPLVYKGPILRADRAALALSVCGVIALLSCATPSSPSAIAPSGGSDSGVADTAAAADSQAAVDSAETGHGTPVDSSAQTDAAVASDTLAAVDIGRAPQDTASSDTSSPLDAAPDIDLSVTISASKAPTNKPLPQFAKVQDTTGAFRKPADLLGKWTVIWFYPAASTFG